MWYIQSGEPFTFRKETSGVREQVEEINYIGQENKRKREEKYREEMRKEIGKVDERSLSTTFAGERRRKI